METQITDLAAWLTAVWDEEERLARDAASAEYPGPEWILSEDDVVGAAHGDYVACGPYEGDIGEEIGSFIAANDPASVLARIAADRKILAWCTERDRIYVGTLASDPSDPANYVPGSLAHPTDSVALRLLASAYADRPGFNPRWSVERQGVEQ